MGTRAYYRVRTAVRGPVSIHTHSAAPVAVEKQGSKGDTCELMQEERKNLKGRKGATIAQRQDGKDTVQKEQRKTHKTNRHDQNLSKFIRKSSSMTLKTEIKNILSFYKNLTLSSCQ